MPEIEDADFFDPHFIGLRPALIRKCGGDSNMAIVLTHIHYRCKGRQADADGWWRGTLETVSEETGLSSRQVATALAKLVTLGYLDREKKHVDGKWDQTRSYRPHLAVPPENMHVSSSAEEHLTSSVEEHLTGKSNVSTTQDITTDRSKTTHAREPGDQFDEFWKTYPRREGKGAARTAFVKAVRKVGTATILAGAARYRDDPNRDDAFTAHPSTWLNQERWADDPLPPRAKPNGRTPNTSILQGALQRMCPPDGRTPGDTRTNDQDHGNGDGALPAAEVRGVHTGRLASSAGGPGLF